VCGSVRPVGWHRGKGVRRSWFFLGGCGTDWIKTDETT